MDLLLYIFDSWFFLERESLRYSYVGPLGKGSTSTVGKYYDQQMKMHVAVKKVTFSSPSKARYQESESLALLNGKHPAFLEFYRSYQTGNGIHIVMEVVKGVELYDRLLTGPLSEKEAGKYFYQLVSAMRIAHEEGIIHRDLKPEHVYLCENSLKIVDWGYSVLLNGEETYSNSCGSPHYASPEILEEIPVVCTGNDVWSLGVILFTMLTGRFLVYADLPHDLLNKIRGLKFNLDQAKIPTGPMNLLKKILVPLSQRITCKEILEDPWLSGFKETFKRKK